MFDKEKKKSVVSNYKSLFSKIYKSYDDSQVKDKWGDIAGLMNESGW
jgi:hypothetical protein